MGLLDMDVSPNLSFDEYQDRFKDFYHIQRDEQGVIDVRMTNPDGGETMWLMEHKNCWGPLLQAIGADDDNEVLILGGTGKVWCLDVDPEYVKKVGAAVSKSPDDYRKFMLSTFQVVPRMFESLIWGVDVPTIGVINGPGGHYELAFMCDIVLCVPDMTFDDPHFSVGAVPGDGMYLCMKKAFGTARANYYAVTGESFTAQQALDWGLVSELVPVDRIYERAHEIANSMMKQSRATRRMTHDMFRNDWRRVLTDDLKLHDCWESIAGMMSWGSRN